NRALVSAKATDYLDSTVFSNPDDAVLLPRSALALNANLLERIPKVDGFFSLYFPAFGGWLLEILRDPANPSFASALDFLGVSHFNGDQYPWNWMARDR